MQGVPIIDFLNFYEIYNRKEDFVSKSEIYFNIHNKNNRKNKIRKDELDSIYFIFDNYRENLKREDEFYLGYEIPQIGKEFDLFLFREYENEKLLINIEIKKQDIGAEKVLKQLELNQYYINGSNLEIDIVYYFTYILEENFYYTLESYNLNPDELLRGVFCNGINCKWGNINNYFRAKDYLISPFNEVYRFLNREYFFTSQQDEINKAIESTTKNTFIKGQAGTGKTLLLYDSFKMNKEESIMVHCGNLNAGHLELKEQGFNIIPVKNINGVDTSGYSRIYVDEFQRINRDSLNKLKDKAIEKRIIAAYDPKQVFNEFDKNENVEEKIKLICEEYVTYKLKDKIRTNKEIATFIKKFYDYNKYIDKKLDTKNISLSLHTCEDELIKYINKMSTLGYTYICHTPTTHRYRTIETRRTRLESVINSHRVLGQEFDNVIIVIDETLKIADNRLIYSSYEATMYDYRKTLFQQLTRVRGKLHICIIENESVYNYILKILSN